jgi:dTDP-4-dehydrorhamnose 3,5-epimerase
MKVFDTPLPEVKTFEPRVFSDSRGYFFENWNAGRYADFGIPNQFVQDNISYSTQNVVRGLHFQHPNPQGKLISILNGEIFDVAVDIRPNSPSFKQWVGVTLSAEHHRQLWIPEGFAHGFAVLSSSALVSYKTTAHYSPQDEQTLIWNDPQIGISWPVKNPIVSEKDIQGLTLKEISLDKLGSI